MAESNINWGDEISDDNEDWPEFTGVSMQAPNVPAETENFKRTLSQPMFSEVSTLLLNENIAAEESMCVSDEEIKPQPPGTGSGSVVQSGRNKGRGSMNRGTITHYRGNSGVPFGFNRGHGHVGGQDISANAFPGHRQSNMQPGVIQFQGIRHRSHGHAAWTQGHVSRARGLGFSGRGDSNRGRGDSSHGRGMNLNIDLNPDVPLVHPLAIFDPAAEGRITNMMNNFSLMYIATPTLPPNNPN